MARASTRLIFPVERIATRIYVIRGLKVMLDVDLAALYGFRQKFSIKQFGATPTGFPKTSSSSSAKKWLQV